MRIVEVLCCVGVLALASACAPGRGGWDAEALARAHPGWSQIPGQRLADAAPYWRPARAADGSRELVLYLCRWADPNLQVSLPTDADERELRLLRRALEAWESAGLGLRFEEVDESEASLRIRLLQRSGERDPEAIEAPTALTQADCRAAPDAALVDAELVLERSKPDWIGRRVEIEDEEFFAAAIHELGHALGFQGHTAASPSIMVRTTDTVRRTGRRVLDGASFRDPTLEALYAVPSGAEVGRLPLRADQAAWIVVAEAAARKYDWRGPFVRVGDRATRLFWRDAEGEEIVLWIADWSTARRDPSKVRFIPNRTAIKRLRR